MFCRQISLFHFSLITTKNKFTKTYLTIGVSIFRKTQPQAVDGLSTTGQKLVKLFDHEHVILCNLQQYIDLFLIHFQFPKKKVLQKSLKKNSKSNITTHLNHFMFVPLFSCIKRWNLLFINFSNLSDRKNNLKRNSTV